MGQYNVPVHLAVDNNEFVFVVDRENKRVTLLSLTYVIRQVVSPDDLKGRPNRLCLDIHRRRLYVNENAMYVNGNYNTLFEFGRTVVFSV